MAITVEVWSDFVCPFCYLIAQRLERLRRNHDLDVRWRAYMLHPPGTPGLPAEATPYIEQERDRVVQIAQAEFGQKLNPGPIAIGTELAHVGAKYAEGRGRADEFHAAVMQAYWQRGLDISDRRVLEELAAGIGLQGDDVAIAVEDPTLVAAVFGDMEQAHTYDIDSVPTLLIAGQYVLVGAQPVEIIRQVLENAPIAA